MLKLINWVLGAFKHRRTLPTTHHGPLHEALMHWDMNVKRCKKGQQGTHFYSNNSRCLSYIRFFEHILKYADPLTSFGGKERPSLLSSPMFLGISSVFPLHRVTEPWHTYSTSISCHIHTRLKPMLMII